MEITGTVTYVDLSGGFWGISADNGQKYTPVHSLPADYQQEGLRVKAQVQPQTGVGIFMWGQQVTIKRIEKR